MSAGHLTERQSHWNRAVASDLDRKHRKWPLGTPVAVKTPAGYLRGRVVKHWRKGEVQHGASVEFPQIVDMEDANGARYCHVIPFRSMKPIAKGEGK